MANQLDDLLFQQYAFRFEVIAANSFHLKKDVVIRVILHKIAVLIRPFVGNPAKSLNRDYIIGRDVYDVWCVDGKKEIAAV